MDTDGDGVPDDRDQCPHTPKGAKVDNRGCWIISDTLFSFGKYSVNPKYNHLIDKIVVVLEKNPSLTIEIQGHTDNIGSNAYNAKLSEKRAMAVRDYLAKKGVNSKRLYPVGYGSLRPIATNKTEAGRELNRRVELVPMK
ncbi:MAG TPA: OmpA family protein [Deltaproteobacteria bacterium]|nr:OmpA family protein [Deltaproteobacteria bacterium]